MLLGHRVAAKPLEMRDQLLALAQEASLGEDPGADAALDALHERGVLAADLVVERQQLVDPGLVDARREEVRDSAGLRAPAFRLTRLAGAA